MNKRLQTFTAALALLSSSSTLQAENMLEITRAALEQDPQLQIARLDREIQQEQATQARAPLLPSLTTSASYDYGDNSRYSNENRGESYSLTLSQSLYNRAQQKQLEQEKITTREKMLGVEQEQQQLLLRSASAYFDHLSAEESVRLAEQELNATAEQLKQIRKQFEVGTISMTDLQEVQARYDLNRAQLVSAKAARSNSYEVLFELVNREISKLQPLQPQIPLQPPAPQQPKAWIEQALEQNLALQQLEQQRQADTAAIEAARAGHYPTVDLTGSLSRNENSNNLYGSDYDSYSVGIQATLPLLNGGSTRSKVTQARQQLQQIEAKLEQQRRSTVKRVRSSYLAVVTAIELVKAQQQVVASAETALKATHSGVSVGTRITVDLLDAQKELFSARRSLSQARYDLLLSRLTLRQEVGTLTIEDIESVNLLLKHHG